MSKPPARTVRAILLMALIALALAFAIRPVRDFIRADACLDAGGRWDDAVRACHFS